jgi:hypothetical protein
VKEYIYIYRRIRKADKEDYKEGARVGLKGR